MPGVGLAIFASDLLLPQLGKQQLESLTNPMRTALESAGSDGTIQCLELIVWDANRNLL